jgi:hypothetical protein
MNQGQLTLRCFSLDDTLLTVARLSGVSQEPQTSIRPAEQIDLVRAEIDTSQTQLGDRLNPVERKSDSQVLIGEQLLDNHSNARS